MNASPALTSLGDAWARREAHPGLRRSALHELRANAMANFNRLGLPTMRDESWRYGNLRALSLRSFQPAAATPLTPVPASWLDAAAAWQTIHLVNGIAQPGAMVSGNGIELQSLSQLERTDPQRLARLSPIAADAEQQRWLLLNTALYEDGMHVRLEGECPRPLLIVHHAVARDAGTLSHPRIIIEAAAGSRAIVLEHHLDGVGGEMLVNSACILHLGAAAHLEHYRIFSSAAQTTHFDHLLVHQSADSSLLQHTSMLGGGQVRATLESALGAHGASLDNHTMIATLGEEHCDAVNLVSHEAVRTRSRQAARLIAGHGGRATFNSKVIVQRGAQKSDSVQSCRGLLLTPRAEIDARPQLEIHADDVKCAHGATTGRLDPDMLFYLLSRGLERTTAQSLLVFAFLADVLGPMSLEPARRAVEAQLVNRLPDSGTLRQFR